MCHLPCFEAHVTLQMKGVREAYRQAHHIIWW